MPKRQGDPNTSSFRVGSQRLRQNVIRQFPCARSTHRY